MSNINIIENKTIAKKTFGFGKHAVSSGRKINLVELEVRLAETPDGKPVFTASATAWNSRHTDCVWDGQCIDTFLEICPELGKDKTYMLIHDLWKRNHLNDMHAGTERQEKAIAEWKAEGNQYNYTNACEHLKAVGLYDDNGYIYGTAWLYRDIPDDDLKAIKGLLEIK